MAPNDLAPAAVKIVIYDLENTLLTGIMARWQSK
jgi:hypothetical protein